jgi:hypothetical protein
VTVVFRILDRALKEVSASRVVLTPEQLTKSAGADASFALPLETLLPGSYVLRVEASSAGVGARVVPFTVN